MTEPEGEFATPEQGDGPEPDATSSAPPDRGPADESVTLINAIQPEAFLTPWQGDDPESETTHSPRPDRGPADESVTLINAIQPQGYFAKPWEGDEPEPKAAPDRTPSGDGVTLTDAVQPNGFFTQPWQPGGGEAPVDPAPPSAAVPAGGASAGAATPASSSDDPLAGFPARDVSAEAQAQIAALPPNDGWDGANVWQAALTCITQGLAKCDILEAQAKLSTDERVPELMAAEMTKERAELKALQKDYQKRYDDYAASLERAEEIREKAHKEAMAEEAKRQAMRDEGAALETKLWKERWDVSKARSDASHKDFIESLTNKYWSSR